MAKRIECTVNGRPVSVTVEPHWTLSRLLRRELGLTGTKEGCGEGECGTCTVLVDGGAFNSCLFMAVDADGRQITTIEGLAEGESLHPLQEAFIEKGAIQCGFCTPGMVISAKALLDRNPRPSEGEIKVAMSGNLCRCTGYAKILEAVEQVANYNSSK